MLSNFKEFVKKNESDIILTIGIILIALISFGAGQLTAPQADIEPIVIQNPITDQTTQTASIQQTVSETNQSKEQGIFVGSKNSNKYHWPNCSFAKRISEENQIWFSSEAEAQAAGYIRCSSFEKYIPAGYKP
ncbi:MAG: hypothetical protein HQ537_00825 [Parcubacteria group bacterium]|nr:hypothetical protein [Parcubacteria group bacterium]